MPTYEYQCPDCEHQFEAFQKITDDPITDCPECGKDNVQRLISATAFHLKGSGWYKTDYASNGSSASASKKGSSEKSSSDKASAAKTDTAKADSSPSKSSDSSPSSD